MPELINDGCPFCLANKRLDENKILNKRRWAYMVHEHGQSVPGTIQIVPYWHDMNVVQGLLFVWSLFWLFLLAKRQFGCAFNLSANFGSDAGQTVMNHVHVWLIPRRNLYAGKGHAFYIALNARAKRELGLDLEQLLNQRIAQRH